LRADCETSALTMAHLLLTHPEQFHSVEDVIDAVPRATNLPRGSGAGSRASSRNCRN
jgi:hypothetical protein